MPNPANRLPSKTWMRPTMSKVREALISILRPQLAGARVLDLFAGTGSLGIAALEAGAEYAVFVESDSRSLKYLSQELEKHFPAASQARADNTLYSVVLGRLPQSLARLKGQFDIIIADPPYNSQEGPQTLAQLASILLPGGTIVFEHHHKEPYPQQVGQLVISKVKRYGETSLSFWERAEDDSR